MLCVRKNRAFPAWALTCLTHLWVGQPLRWRIQCGGRGTSYWIRCIKGQIHLPTWEMSHMVSNSLWFTIFQPNYIIIPNSAWATWVCSQLSLGSGKGYPVTAQRTQHLSCLEHMTCDGMWGLMRFQRCHPYSSHNDVHLPGWDLGAPTAVAAVSKMYLVHWRKRPGWVKSMINVLIFCKIRGLCLLSFSLRSLGIFFQEPTCYLFLHHRLWHRQLEEVFAKIGKLDSSNVSMKCVRCSHKMLTEDTSKAC